MDNNASSKCKVVLLGDQSVGKTSIINRFIFDNFTGNEQVNFFNLFSLLSESILSRRISQSKIRILEYKFGTQQVNNAFIPSSPPILRIVTLRSSFTI
jgi:GTPase SAR1 family protein